MNVPPWNALPLWLKIILIPLVLWAAIEIILTFVIGFLGLVALVSSRVAKVTKVIEGTP